jgi:hypothetical protein
MSLHNSSNPLFESIMTLVGVSMAAIDFVYTSIDNTLSILFTITEKEKVIQESVENSIKILSNADS